jgi:DNA-binding MarR family transcriptional regulator
MLQIHKVMATISLSSLQSLAKIDTLKKRDYRVLLFLMSHLDSLRPKKVDKKQIARELLMDKKEVSKALDNLVDAGILFYGDSEHVEKGYMFKL